MGLKYGHIMLFVWMLMHVRAASAQQNIVFVQPNGHSAVPITAIDSLKPLQPKGFHVFMKERTAKTMADTVLFCNHVPDTVLIDYHDEKVFISNPRLGHYDIITDKANVIITARGGKPFVCQATGSSCDGRLIINADTTMKLLLNNLTLTSKQASAINLRQKQKVTIVLPDSTTSTLEDAADYHPADTTETANGCLYARGSMAFEGGGKLYVTGNNRHGISSGKNITSNNTQLVVSGTIKDAIHCDKFTLNGGDIRISLSNEASKGIKAKEEISIKGGTLEGVATGGITFKDGDVSYCTLLKSEGVMNVSGGSLSLKHYGTGGRCISVDKNMTITGGTFDMECHGNGGSYLIAANDSDYFTPKCITVDDSLHITGGNILCTSTGLGGKGIVTGKYLVIGSAELLDEPIIRVETKGECIINNKDEDQRFGCPKGIKANDELHIYSGDIAVTTAGMGGEGVECNGKMYIHGGTIECNTFDDGINVGQSIEISGGQIYCNSVDNDGIDSNGSITISGGIVASVNQSRPNESFDNENGQLYLIGGTVFGIGSRQVEISKASLPSYSTPFNDSVDEQISLGFIISTGKYIYVQKGDEVVMALRNDNRAFRTFVTIMSPSFYDSEHLIISEGNTPLAPILSYFGGKLTFGGMPSQSYPISEIQVKTIK